MQRNGGKFDEFFVMPMVFVAFFAFFIQLFFAFFNNGQKKIIDFRKKTPVFHLSFAKINKKM
jgi:hypothetical protein